MYEFLCTHFPIFWYKIDRVMGGGHLRRLEPPVVLSGAPRASQAAPPGISRIWICLSMHTRTIQRAQQKICKSTGTNATICKDIEKTLGEVTYFTLYKYFLCVFLHILIYLYIFHFFNYFLCVFLHILIIFSISNW